MFLRSTTFEFDLHSVQHVTSKYLANFLEFINSVFSKAFLCVKMMRRKYFDGFSGLEGSWETTKSRYQGLGSSIGAPTLFIKFRLFPQPIEKCENRNINLINRPLLMKKPDLQCICIRNNNLMLQIKILSSQKVIRNMKLVLRIKFLTKSKYQGT